MKLDANEIREKILSHDTILITAHENADGDALGSCLGLFHFLENQGKQAAISLPEKPNPKFRFLPGFDKIKTIEETDLEKFSCLVILDTDKTRIGSLKNFPREVLNVDHHVTNDLQADFVWLTRSSSTCEMIFTLIGDDLTFDIAKCLFTGLWTDTGGFQFNNTKSSTHLAAAKCLDLGVKSTEIVEQIAQKTQQEAQAQIEAYQTIEFFADGQIAGLFLKKPLAEKFISTDGLIEFVRNVSGVKIAVLVKEVSENLCRVSLRSKKIDMSGVAQEFGGGGHRLAAGCSLDGNLEAAKEILLKRLEACL